MRIKKNNHVKLIVGTFIVGTLAFMFAHSWNGFIEKSLELISETTIIDINKEKGLVILSGIYVVIITIICIVVMYILITVDFVKH